MCFPIDKETFDRIRRGRSPISEPQVDMPINTIWRYWMTDDGEEVFAILGNYVIKFGDYPIDLTISDTAWTLSFISEEKPKEAILNHVFRGQPAVLEHGTTNLCSGVYELSCPAINKSYVIYMDILEEFGYLEVNIWWPEKSKLLRSLPLIYEMNSFFKSALWKKF